jgi:hypothetical protein
MSVAAFGSAAFVAETLSNAAALTAIAMISSFILLALLNVWGC